MPSIRPVVLLADDEPSVREIVSLVLKRAEYEVLTAGDAAAGLALLQGTPRIDLVLTDVQMAEGCMNGFEFAAEVIARRPGVPVVIMSGVQEYKRLALEKGLRFLAKPFTPAAILSEIRSALLGIPAQFEVGRPSRSKAG